MAEHKLRLGVIDVLNVLPVYYGIIKQLIPVSCTILKGKVTELNNALAEGRIDISVVSSFEYARNHELYYVFPNLSVGANGPVRSIYLFLNKPLEQLDRDIITLTEFSLTSVHLIRFILQEYNVTFTQNHTKQATGELLIADDAIRRFYQKRDAHVYDLSELWKKRTGLPFVFALWVCRRDVYEKYPAESLAIFNALIASKKQAKGLYRQMAEEGFPGIFPDAASCEEYLKNIHYELSIDYQRGFLLFQKELLKLGLLNQIAPIEFLPDL
jgi:chorismate dehydratase